MTRWARLTWQVPDPAAFAQALAGRLGMPGPARGESHGVFVLDLGTAVLEIRPWVRETPSDGPSPDGRLMLEPVPGGDEEPGGADDARLVLAAVGWATVDLDRADDELGPWLGAPLQTASAGSRSPSPAVDPHLGARARVRVAGGLPGDAFVLLEPDTEGRLAASLARHGEGPCALYLRPAEALDAWSAAARERGVRLSAPRPGPLGTSRLVLGGTSAGPHLLLVGARRTSNRKPAASTIDP